MMTRSISTGTAPLFAWARAISTSVSGSTNAPDHSEQKDFIRRTEPDFLAIAFGRWE